MKEKKQNVIQYDYIVHNISEDDIPAYKAIVPALGCVVYGDNLTEIETGLQLAIKAEINEREQNKKPIPAPDRDSSFSGKFVVRVDPDLHERLMLEAKAKGKSLNSYVKEKLAYN